MACRSRFIAGFLSSSEFKVVFPGDPSYLISRSAPNHMDSNWQRRRIGNRDGSNPGGYPLLRRGVVNAEGHRVRAKKRSQRFDAQVKLD